MYKNIGWKIKLLAIATFPFITTASIVIALYLMYSNKNLIPVALIIILVGSVTSLISSLFIYGFGELIDKAIEIERNTSAYKKSYSPNSLKKYAKQNQKSLNKKAELDENLYHNVTCPNCSEELYYLDSELNSAKQVTCPYCDHEFIIR